MKITFIEPKGAFEGFSFGWLNKMPMVGIVYLATILKHRGHEVEVRKESVKAIDCSKLDCDVLCISIMTSTARRGYWFASQYKRYNPKGKVIIGGVHATFLPQEAAKYADHVLVGEADSIITDIVEGKYKEKIIYGKKCEDLDELPFPDFSLIKDLKLPMPHTPISTSRGCPFNCKFCSVTSMFGRQYRFRSPENIVDEIISSKHRNLFFYDDNFGALNSRTKEILTRMAELKLDIPWKAQARTEVVNDNKLLNLMVKTHCRYLCIGFESINPKTLEAYNKSQKLEGVKRSIKVLHDFGIKIHGMFVFGSDEDDKKVIKDTVDFCNTMDIESPQFSILTPLPGSALYSELESQGRIFSKNWKLYDCHHAVFTPRNMSAYELQKRVMEAVSRLYWITRRGIKFFFKDFGSSVSILSKCLKWERQNSRYLAYLRSLMNKSKPLPKANVLPSMIIHKR